MVKIITEIQKELPMDKISSIELEGANIVIYTTSADFLFKGREKIKTLILKYKKRIALRADNTLLVSIEESKKIITEILKDNTISDFKFDTARSKLIIEVANVGMAIGEKGCNLREMQKRTRWSPLIKRSVSMNSVTVSSMRSIEFNESEYRRKFLNRVGKKIYGGWDKGKIGGWARVTMLGAGNQIGRSAIYLQTNESRILFDCGIDPSYDFSNQNAFPYFDSPDFKIEDIDAVVLSHAHLDHCGLLPLLYKMGYKGPIYCTEPTRDIMALSLIDFVKIMNQKTNSQPLYTINDIKEMLKHVITLNYKEVTDITSNLRLTFYNSGHILGSAFCHINIGNGVHNFMYTGDFNYSYRQRLLNKAEDQFPRLETLMMEGTNVGPEDYAKPRNEMEEEFLKILIDSYVKKSKVLVPVFGIGRAQEMLLTIGEFIREKRLPEDFKVYVDGMVHEVTAIHSDYPDFLHNQLRNRIFRGDNPFLLPNFIGVQNGKHRDQVIEEKDQGVFIATSGMLSGGTSVEYFKRFANDEKNAIVFVGYQAAGTLGRRIKEGDKDILLANSGNADDRIKVKMQVYGMKGAFSAHSDLAINRKFIASLSVKPKKVILNHGNRDKLKYFAENIKTIIPCKTAVPENLESVRLI